MSDSMEIKNLDDFYIEDSKTPFRVAAAKVQNEEYLSNLWKTKKIYCIPSSKAGIYLLYNLHRNPHYHLPHAVRSNVQSKSANLGVPFVLVDKKSYTKKGIIYHDTHLSPKYQNIESIIKEMDLKGVIKKLATVPKTNKRGNIAITFGWQNHNFVPNQGINIPFNDTLDGFDRKIVKQMTQAYLSSYGAAIPDAPFTTNKQRTRNYADQLVKIGTTSTSSEIENIFESVTYAMTFCDNSSGTQLRMHIDSLNCYENGFNAVYGMYFILNHPTEKNQYIRLVLLGYSRRAIYHTMNRFEKRNMFKEHLKRYVSYVGERNMFHLENAISFQSSKQKDPTIITKLPFIDKCGFYSIFTSAIYDIIRNCKNIVLEDIVEMVLPIGWLCTGSNYYRILSQWCKNGLPKGNLTVILLETLVQEFGGISKGEGMRVQPFCNSPIPLSKIYQGQQILYNFINYANNCSNCDIQRAMVMLEKIHYVRGLGAQHIMCVLTLLRVVYNTSYVRSTILLETNATAKRIQKEYSLNSKLTNILYEELALESYKGSSRMVENLVCEFFRDIQNPTSTDWNFDSYDASIKKRKNKKPDTFFSNQSIFFEKNFSIYRHFYDNDGSIVSQNMEILELAEDKDRDWHSGLENIGDKVIYVTKDQKKSGSSLISNDNIPDDNIVSDEKMVSPKMKGYGIQKFLKHYSGIQKEILTMYMKNISDWEEKDVVDYSDLSWFDGVSKFTNTDCLLHEIAKSGKKRKRTKNKRSANDIEHHVSNEKTVFSKSINGQNCVHYVQSSNDNVCQKGFYGMFAKRICGYNYCLAFYESEGHAQLALKMVLFTGTTPNIVSDSNMSILLNNLEDKKHIALFERIDGIAHFFCFLSKKDNKVFLNIPIDDSSPLKGPWQEFCCELS